MQVQKTLSFDVPTVAGVAFDGEAVWTSLVADGQTKLTRLEPATGRVLRERATPVISGLAWDGDNLWGVTADGIHRYDPETLEVTRTLPRPAFEGFLSGLAWDGEALWLGVYHGKKLLKLDPETGAVLRELDADRHVTGITWIGDELWHATSEDRDEDDVCELRRIDARSGAVLERHEVPYAVSGLEHDGKAFWCGDCASGQLRVVERRV
jgi:streptogramin lyase